MFIYGGGVGYGGPSQPEREEEASGGEVSVTIDFGEEKVDPFQLVLDEVAALQAKKRKDYGSEEDPYYNLRSAQLFGIRPWVAALMRLTDKVYRLQRFVRRGTLANEGAEDSLLDISTYALLALILLREEQEGRG